MVRDGPLPYASPDDAAHAAAFFQGRPAGAALWDALVRHAMTWGPIQVTATKVRVCLKARTRFAWCPKAHNDGHIFVRFLVPFALGPSPRLENPRPVGGRISYRVKIDAPDDEVLEWLRAAYEADAQEM